MCNTNRCQRLVPKRWYQLKKNWNQWCIRESMNIKIWHTIFNQKNTCFFRIHDASVLSPDAHIFWPVMDTHQSRNFKVTIPSVWALDSIFYMSSQVANVPKEFQNSKCHTFKQSLTKDIQFNISVDSDVVKPHFFLSRKNVI